MNVVKSASSSDIESASHVFERQSDGSYTLIKARHYGGAQVGKTYDREIAVMFASLNPGTLIIEGGYDMSTESNANATNNQRTITLVTIPQEVADALEGERDGGFSTEETIETVVGPRPEFDIFRSIPFETLLSALVNGYVIEKSAEELAHNKIRAEYTVATDDANVTHYYDGYADGIESTLGNLGIKIEGVNA